MVKITNIVLQCSYTYDGIIGLKLYIHCYYDECFLVVSGSERRLY